MSNYQVIKGINRIKEIKSIIHTRRFLLLLMIHKKKKIVDENEEKKNNRTERNMSKVHTQNSD